MEVRHRQLTTSFQLICILKFILGLLISFDKFVIIKDYVIALMPHSYNTDF